MGPDSGDERTGRHLISRHLPYSPHGCKRSVPTSKPTSRSYPATVELGRVCAAEGQKANCLGVLLAQGSSLTLPPRCSSRVPSIFLAAHGDELSMSRPAIHFSSAFEVVAASVTS